MLTAVPCLPKKQEGRSLTANGSLPYTNVMTNSSDMERFTLCAESHGQIKGCFFPSLGAQQRSNEAEEGKPTVVPRLQSR